ncbi:DUF1206 domain-containing protein [Phenylobacterium sp.]|jgi:hypothetical protein|uniref:DUF1206 domain-containing protein n=1 Tax=Phenylobacterium sp. TaxID=1871053 RepID=UPI002F91C91E
MNAVPRLETLTRLGFAARGVLYLTIAWLAIEAHRTTGSAGALRSMAGGGMSRVALAVIALGLLAYGAWRCAEGLLDLEGAGDGAKGALVRLVHGTSGVLHLVLGLLAGALALGMSGAGAGGGGGADSATGWVLGLPGGGLILRLAALGFMAGGLAQGWSAYRLKFLKQLDPPAAGRPWIKWIGRLGYLARGVVFVLIGWLLWRAASASDPQQAGGVGEALASLSGWMRVAVAGGLGLFGVFSIVQAAYRRITDPHVLSRLAARSPAHRSAARGRAGH